VVGWREPKEGVKKREEKRRKSSWLVHDDGKPMFSLFLVHDDPITANVVPSAKHLLSWGVALRLAVVSLSLSSSIAGETVAVYFPTHTNPPGQCLSVIHLTRCVRFSFYVGIGGRFTWKHKTPHDAMRKLVLLRGLDLVGTSLAHQQQEIVELRHTPTGDPQEKHQ
jgi:hypothetical protein